MTPPTSPIAHPPGTKPNPADAQRTEGSETPTPGGALNDPLQGR